MLTKKEKQGIFNKENTGGDFMKNKIIGNTIIFFMIFLFSCETLQSNNQSGNQSFSRWYNPWINVKERNDIIILKQDEQPRITRSYNIDDDAFDLLSEYFIIVGRTGFNGTASDQENLVENIRRQCRQNGATIAIYEIAYTDTRSGSFSSGGSYNIRRYDYVVYYFVKSTAERDLIGLWLRDLDSEERRRFQRNTGAIVNVVYRNSPAFIANIQKDDIIIRINDHNINDKDDYWLISLFLSKGTDIEIEYIRNNRNQIVRFRI
jgi:hypothetical protein